MLMQAIKSLITKATATINARLATAVYRLLSAPGQPADTLIRTVYRRCIGLHCDERGDNENLGRLLILALVLVPLIILITIFGDAIYAEAQAQWDAVMGSGVG